MISWPITQGERNPMAKLHEADVRSIRSRAAAGEMQKYIAEDFRISQSVVSKIARRQRWGHVK